MADREEQQTAAEKVVSETTITHPVATKQALPAFLRWGLIAFVVVLIVLIALASSDGSVRQTIVYSLLGAIAGTIGGAACEVVARMGGKAAHRATLIVATLFALVVTRVPAATERAMNVAEALFPTEEGRILAQLDKYPEVRQWITASKGMTSAERTRVSAEIAAKGIRKLDDQLILERAAILGHLLSVATEAECAAAARTGNYVTILTAHADERTRERFQHIAWTAMAAQLREIPDRTYSEADLYAAIETATEGFSPERLQKLADTLEGNSTASAGDACFAWRKLHNAIPSLSRRQGLALASMLAGVEPAKTP
jgi:hypothetical protein